MCDIGGDSVRLFVIQSVLEKKIINLSQVDACHPVNSEAKAGRLQVQSQPQQLCETLSQG